MTMLRYTAALDFISLQCLSPSSLLPPPRTLLNCQQSPHCTVECLCFPSRFKTLSTQSRGCACPIPETPAQVTPGTEQSPQRTRGIACPPPGEVLSPAQEAARRQMWDKALSNPATRPEKLRRQTRCTYGSKLTISSHQRQKPALLDTCQTCRIMHTLHKDKNSTALSLKSAKQGLWGPTCDSQSGCVSFQGMILLWLLSPESKVHTNCRVGSGKNSKHCFITEAAL